MMRIPAVATTQVVMTSVLIYLDTCVASLVLAVSV